MDYLQEGINLRAMGQKDPLVEWQREGFEMFGGMMKGIAQDFVRYVMHVQVVQNEQPAEQAKNVQEISSKSQPDQSGVNRAAAAAAASGEIPAQAVPAQSTAKPQQVIKDEFDKTPRNAPCPCGSGKKFKQCHGAA
jgi:preprotein translocase subunit SecA